MSDTWTPQAHPAIVDLSRNNQAAHFNSGEFYHALREAGVQLVIHKASQGTSYPRSAVALYAQRRRLAVDAGLRFDAYHFLTAAPAKDQIAYFLSAAELDATMRGALDCENNPSTADTVTPAIANAAIKLLDQQRGAQALRYTGAGYVTPKRVPQLRDFLNGPLWLAKYGPAPTTAFLRGLGMDPVNLVIWQFSGSGAIGGEHPVDLSSFHGTAEELAAWPALTRFPLAGGTPPPAAPVAAHPTLRFGDRGNDVGELQRRLLGLGYVLPRFGADADYGGETLLAVKAFQQTRRLAATGVFDAASWTALAQAELGR